MAAEVQAKIGLGHDMAELMGAPRGAKIANGLTGSRKASLAQERCAGKCVVTCGSVCRHWLAAEGVDQLRAVIHRKVRLLEAYFVGTQLVIGQPEGAEQVIPHHPELSIVDLGVFVLALVVPPVDLGGPDHEA